jgi:hypothetical protein
MSPFGLFKGFFTRKNNNHREKTTTIERTQIEIYQLNTGNATGVRKDKRRH